MRAVNKAKWSLEKHVAASFLSAEPENNEVFRGASDTSRVVRTLLQMSSAIVGVVEFYFNKKHICRK